MNKETINISLVDALILVAYVIMMITVPILLRNKQKTQEDYLLGGRRMHWFLVGTSLIAVLFSGISLVGAPGYSFKYDCRLYASTVAGLLVMPAMILILPYLVGLKVISIYEYLEQRFSKSLRVLASLLFLLSRGMYVAVVIYTLALFLSTIIGVSFLYAIIFVGILATLLTTLGGLQAVIWTDAIQFFIMSGGLLLTLVILIKPSSGGVVHLWQIADQAGRTKFLDFSVNPQDATFWASIVSAAFVGVGYIISDQTQMQQYASSGSKKAVIRSYVFSVVVSTIFVGILYFTGVLLFGFYGTGQHTMPESVRINGDKVLPYFIRTELSSGVKGLVIAGIVSATISTITAVLNSLCAVTVRDFYDSFFTKSSRWSPVLISRIVTIIWGVLTAFLACYIDRLGTVVEAAIKLTGLTGGGLTGIFYLGLFSKRANSTGTLIGAIAGTAATTYVMFCTEINFLLYLPVGAVVTMVIGYLSSITFSYISVHGRNKK